MAARARRKNESYEDYRSNLKFEEAMFRLHMTGNYLIAHRLEVVEDPATKVRVPVSLSAGQYRRAA